MNLFKDMLRGDESLFVNEMVLDFDYMPHIIKYRENQQGYLAECIKPLLLNRNGRNLIITGKPGIGKTIAVKHIFNELKKEDDKIKTIYVNCWKKDSPYKVALEICNQIGYRWIQNKKTDELVKEIAKILNKGKVVFCFDEVDKLNDLGIIYSLLEDIHRKTIFLITNDSEFLSKIDDRIKSRLMADSLEFKPYNYEETKGILSQRRDAALVPGVFDESSFMEIVDKTFELEDIRTGLFLLRECGNIAESRSSKKIEDPDCAKAIEKLKEFKKKKLSDLDDEELFVLEIVKNNSEKMAMEVYETYKKKHDKSYKTFQRKLKDLEKGGFIKIKEGKDEQGSIVMVLEYSS